jgi:hypothetical protein
MRSTFVILVVALLVGSIAYLQYGASGLFVVSVGTATVLASMWIATWCAKWFAGADRMAAGLLAGTGVRMLLPLAAVLGLVTLGREHIEARSVLYIVPIYFAMLIVDTLAATRRIHSPRRPIDSESQPPNRTVDS